MLRTGVQRVVGLRVVSPQLSSFRTAKKAAVDDFGLREVPLGGRNANMLPQPIPEEIRRKERLVSPEWFKQSTGLTGLFVNETPHHSLTVAYGRIMRLLQLMPEEYKYRQHTESIIKHRMQIVQDETDPEKMESRIGMGQIEELVVQAEHELETARSLLEYKAWEPLVSKPIKGQWDWPI